MYSSRRDRGNEHHPYFLLFHSPNTTRSPEKMNEFMKETRNLCHIIFNMSETWINLTRSYILNNARSYLDPSRTFTPTHTTRIINELIN